MTLADEVVGALNKGHIDGLKKAYSYEKLRSPDLNHAVIVVYEVSDTPTEHGSNNYTGKDQRIQLKILFKHKSKMNVDAFEQSIVSFLFGQGWLRQADNGNYVDASDTEAFLARDMYFERMKQMELTGLNDFIVWMYDKDGKVISDPDNGGFTYDGDKGKVKDPKGTTQFPGLFIVDLNSSRGAVQANITGLAPTVNRVYGSNQPAESNTGTEQISVALSANDIPHNVYDLLTGLQEDKDHGGFKRQGNSNPTNGGLIIHSGNTHNGVDLYFAFPQGVFTAGELNLGTNTENPNVVHDALTLSVQARPSDQLMYEKFYSDETGFDYAKMVQFISGLDNTTTSGSGSVAGGSSAGSQA